MKSTASNGFSLHPVTVHRTIPSLVSYQSLSAPDSTVAIVENHVRVPFIYLAPTSAEIKVLQGQSKSSQNRPVYM